MKIKYRQERLNIETIVDASERGIIALEYNGNSYPIMTDSLKNSFIHIHGVDYPVIREEVVEATKDYQLPMAASIEISGHDSFKHGVRVERIIPDNQDCTQLVFIARTRNGANLLASKLYQLALTIEQFLKDNPEFK